MENMIVGQVFFSSALIFAVFTVLVSLRMLSGWLIQLIIWGTGVIILIAGLYMVWS